MKLRRVFAAWLLRLARRLAARSARELPPGDVSAADDAPAHWLALLRPGARRLSMRGHASDANAHAPPEPAPRTPTDRRETPPGVKSAARDADWKVLVRSRARELAAMPAPAIPVREKSREDRASQPDAPVQRAERRETVAPVPRLVEAAKPAVAPPPYAPPSPTPLAKRAVVRAPVPREARRDADDAPLREPAQAHAPQSVHLVSLETSRERPSPQTPATVRKGPRGLALAPVAVPVHRSEQPAVEPILAPRPSSIGRASASPMRASPAAVVDIHRPDTRVIVVAPKERVSQAPAPEPQWPSLPDEAGDVAPVSSEWPVLPRDASEWPSDETLADRSVQSVHETFLRSEQRGERWNA